MIFNFPELDLFNAESTTCVSELLTFNIENGIEPLNGSVELAVGLNDDKHCVTAAEENSGLSISQLRSSSQNTN